MISRATNKTKLLLKFEMHCRNQSGNRNQCISLVGMSTATSAKSADGLQKKSRIGNTMNLNSAYLYYSL